VRYEKDQDYGIRVFAFDLTEASFPQSTNAGVRLEEGIAKEETDGDLKSAMAVYQRIAADSTAPREVRAKALLRLAGC
jgi:hypothetical protein